MFFLRMDSPGIEIRPIKQANGQSGFNEVYFTDVRIPDSQRLGDGRTGLEGVAHHPDERARFHRRGAVTGFPELFGLRAAGSSSRTARRWTTRRCASKLASCAARASGLKFTGMRAISALSKGETPGPENSIGKLVAGSTMQELAMLRARPARPGRRDHRSAEAEAGGAVPGHAAALSRDAVEGGTDEILRNIIAERVLGLPGDIRVDKGVPFNKIPNRAG